MEFHLGTDEKEIILPKKVEVIIRYSSDISKHVHFCAHMYESVYQEGNIHRESTIANGEGGGGAHILRQTNGYCPRRTDSAS